MLLFLFQVNNYTFKVNKRNTRTRCEICLKSTIETPGRRHWRCSGFFIVILEHIPHLALVFLLLIEQVSAGLVIPSNDDSRKKATIV